MEERARRFGDQISFLYNYIREAHPNPQTAPCGPTEDLGWNHPSWNTRSLGERAQRARWLKSDFDLSYPFIVDTMGNTMLHSYRGSGFYSGWIIDCEGTTIKDETWGWATPSTQWCGLHLAQATELDSFLESYLESPAHCFIPSTPQEQTQVLPSVSKVLGFAQTDWRTEVVLVNISSEARTIHLQLRGTGPDSDVVDISLNPGESRLIPDIVGELFQRGGSSALWITSLPGVLASAHVSNQSDTGQYGQFLRALPLHYAIGAPMTAHLYPLEENENFRTNIGLVNARGAASHFALKVFNQEGVLLNTESVDLGPWEYLLKTHYLAPIAGEGIEGLRVEIEAADEDSEAFVFASVVDNISGDPTYFEALPHLYSFDVEVPGVARTEGVENTHWRSRIALVNINSQPVDVQASFQPNGNSDAPGTTSFNLAPHSLRLIDDPLGELFGASGAGTLKFSALDGLAAAGRTFNDNGELGSYGQRSPGLDPSGESTLRPGLLGHLIQLDENQSRRTNLGLVNFGPTAIQIEAIFYASSGAELGRRSYGLAGGKSAQLNRIFRAFTDENVSAGRITVRVLTEGGRATAWASTVDAGNGDPVFQSLSVEDPR